MSISGSAALQSPCIGRSFLHTGLICSLHDLGHATEMLFLMPPSASQFGQLDSSASLVSVAGFMARVPFFLI